jgi:GT2 family glycosyltransferase
VVGTCSLVARREVFARIGGFDPARRVAEDTDWVVRAIGASVTMVMVPRPLLRRRIHGANLSCDAPLQRRELFALLRRQTARRRAGSAP